MKGARRSAGDLDDVIETPRAAVDTMIPADDWPGG